MSSNDHYASLQTTAAGLGVLIVTALMANGEWDVFDFAISIVILGFGYASLQAKALVLSKKWHTAIAATCFGIVTTCAAVGLISALAVIFQSYDLATVDVQTYKQLPPLKMTGEEAQTKVAELYKSQTIWQTGLFLFFFLAWEVHLARSFCPLSNLPEVRRPEDAEPSHPAHDAQPIVPGDAAR